MKKRLYIVFFFLLVVFVIYGFAETYSLLQSQGKAKVEADLGKWNISLNGINVATQKLITVNDLVYEENANVENGYFAPGAKASYKIVIDPNDTDVAIKYDIAIDSSELENHPNIVFEVTDEQGTVLETDGTSFNGVISLADIQAKKKKILDLSLVWENNETYNELDSSLIGKTNIEVLIKINFIQYTGE